jgi:hypothetical protein
MTNRKLRKNIGLEGECYEIYQVQVILKRVREIIRKEVQFLEEVHGFNYADINEYLDKKYNKLSDEATMKYIQSGLALKFEKHHRPNKDTRIIVSKLGQKIN